LRSRAHFRGHPIHPAIVPLPLAFLIGAFGFDAAAVVFDDGNLARTAGLLSLVGIATALLAAIPGLIDYLFAVPPNSTGKRRATTHMIVNLSAVVLFAAAALLKNGFDSPPPLAILAIELVGVALLSAGGWMGGVLVSRNQISVDHRYARAGKWREVKVDVDERGVLVAQRDELEVDQMKLVRTQHGRVVIARTESGWVAFNDRCTHRGGSLADGVMICGTVQCPWHGSQFDVKTGAVKAGPAKVGIPTYSVEQRADGIYLRGGGHEARSS